MTVDDRNSRIIRNRSVVRSYAHDFALLFMGLIHSKEPGTLAGLKQ